MPHCRMTLNLLCAATTEAGDDETAIAVSLITNKGQQHTGDVFFGDVNNSNHLRYFERLHVWEGDLQDNEVAFVTLHFVEDDSNAQAVAHDAAVKTGAGTIALIAGASVPVVGAVVGVAAAVWSLVGRGSDDVIGSVTVRVEVRNGVLASIEHIPAVHCRQASYWEQNQAWPVLLYGDGGQYFPRVDVTLG